MELAGSKLVDLLGASRLQISLGLNVTRIHGSLKVLIDYGAHREEIIQLLKLVQNNILRFF